MTTTLKYKEIRTGQEFICLDQKWLKKSNYCINKKTGDIVNFKPTKNVISLALTKAAQEVQSQLWMLFD